MLRALFACYFPNSRSDEETNIAAAASNMGGWEDKKGNIWQPDTSNHGKNRENGSEEHWDVQRKDGKGYRNVGKDGKTWGGKGKAPNLPKKEEEMNTDNADIGNAIGTGALGLAGGNTRMGSWKMVACPCYCAH